MQGWILFGDQKVTIADVKALANKQQFVPLNDGTLGVLPDEWVKVCPPLPCGRGKAMSDIISV
jgi:hypothetical protein